MRTPKISHKDLVARATKWLHSSVRCGVVLWEHSGCSGETPDAMGWRYNGLVSYLIECKTSRSDFAADATKFARQYPDMGVGRYRYYLCPEDVLRREDMVGHAQGWGLLYTDGWRVREIVKAQQFEKYNHNHEMGMIYHAMRRHRANIEVINKFFTEAFPLRGVVMDDSATETENPA